MMLVVQETRRDFMNRFVKGIILLSIAALFAECLEFVVNMILARELGEHGMGLYMSILPTIFLIIVIASLERRSQFQNSLPNQTLSFMKAC